MDPKLTISDRRELYEKAFPDYPRLQPDPNWLAGFWIIGNWYKRPNDYWGSFPHTTVKRLLAFFPDCNPIMHVFAGSIPADPVKGIFTMDVSHQFNPSFSLDIRDMESSKHADFRDTLRKCDLVVADPYYEDKDFETANLRNKTNLKPLNKTAVIRTLGQHMKSGSFLAWLDVSAPMFSKEQWQVCGLVGWEKDPSMATLLSLYLKEKGLLDDYNQWADQQNQISKDWTLEGGLGVQISTNTRYRAWTIWQRK